MHGTLQCKFLADDKIVCNVPQLSEPSKAKHFEQHLIEQQLPKQPFISQSKQQTPFQ